MKALLRGWLLPNFISILILILILMSAGLALAPAAGAQAALLTPAYSFGVASVRTAPVAKTLTVTISVAGTLGAINVVTQGVADQDFTPGTPDGDVCSVERKYSVGQTCTVTVNFQAKYPGLRQGAVVLKASDGSVLGMQLLNGTGGGATAVFVPGTISTVAGLWGSWTYIRDDFLATQSPLYLPKGGAADAVGNLYLSDPLNYRIRFVKASSGNISTVAGNGVAGFSGDGGAAASAQVNMPADVKLDGAGDFFIADTANHVIRMVNAAGKISTIAGQGGQPGYSGDGGKATSANLTSPSSLAFDGDHKLYISDTGNNAVRMVDLSTGIISSVAGKIDGIAGYSGEGPATSARLYGPMGIALGSDGSLYIADRLNNRIRKVTDSVISTVAGTGVAGYDGDGGKAADAALRGPAAVLVDVAGNIYVADSGNQIVRKVSATGGIINTIAGTPGGGDPTDHIPANTSGLYGPYALFLDGPGNLYIADMFHQLIRMVSANLTKLNYPVMREDRLSPPEPVTIENDGNAELKFSEFNAVTYSELDRGTTTCSVTAPVAVDQACVLGVDFAPTTAGDPAFGWILDGLLSVASNAGNGPSVINLSGKVLSVQPTTATLTSDRNPGGLGTAITFTVVISNGLTAEATGPVNFFDGTTNIGTANLNGTGVAAISTATLSTGTHTITAVYAGDTENAGVTPAALIETVQQQTTTEVSSNHGTDSPSAATPVTFTATVAGPGLSTVLPGGVVTFYDGATAMGTGQMSGGIATLTVSTLIGGKHKIQANYGGDTFDLPSQSIWLIQSMVEAPTTTTLTTSNASVNAGVSVTFTATVLRSDGVPTTGTVTFLDGTIAIGTGPLNAADSATLTTTSLAGGARFISAVYSGDANSLTSTSAIVNEAVAPIATATVVAVSPSPGFAGAAILLTATVVQSGTPGNGGPFSGVTNFMDAGTLLGSAPISAAGLATLSVSTMLVGLHSISASYGGNENYVASTSVSMPETIQSASTSTLLASSASASIAGAPITLTVTVVTSGGFATGTVTFMDGSGSGPIGTGALNAKGIASMSTSSLAVGTHTLTAVYGGDAKDNGSTSSGLNQLVQIATSITTLRSSLNPSPFGSSVTFTASVATNGGAATGTVTFSDGAVVLASVPLTAGMAVFSTSALTLGAHPITAAYAGDANDAASQSAALSEQVQQAGAVTLVSSVNPSIAGAALMFTATIAAPEGAPITGTVAFKDGATTLGTESVSSGVATLNFATLAVGQHQITASYSGDINNRAELSSALNQIVQTAGTSVTLVSSANPVLTKVALTLTSRVVGTGGIATGTVTIQDGTAVLGSSSCIAGVASLIVNGLAPGPHSLVAVYSGDANDVMSTSPALAQSVLQVTTLSISSNDNPALALDAITFTSTVVNGGSRPASGTVVFSDGVGAAAMVLGTVSLGPAGTATFTAASMALGQHTVSATYGGDSMNLASVSSGLSEAVQLRPTSDTLSASSTSLSGGQQVTLISVVRYAGPVAPTGTVSFLSSGATLGTTVVDETGVATFTANLLTSAPVVVAVYSGDGVYAASTSTANSIVVAKPTQFTLQLNPAVVTLQSQQNRTTTLTITSLNGFTDTMDLGCVGLPFAATCTFAPDRIALGGNGVQTIQLVVDTGSPLTAGPQALLEHHGELARMCILPGGVLLGLAFWRGRRKMRRSLAGLAMLVLLACLSVGLSGCAGMHIKATPVGTYVFQVSATAVGTGVSQAIDVTLTVTQ